MFLKAGKQTKPADPIGVIFFFLLGSSFLPSFLEMFLPLKLASCNILYRWFLCDTLESLQELRSKIQTYVVCSILPLPGGK